MAMRLNRLVKIFLEWNEHSRAPATGENYRRMLAYFVKSVGGNTPIDKLKPIQLSTHGKTWHQVQAVQRLFNFAKNDLEIIDRNPFSRVPRPPLGQRSLILNPRETAAYLRRSRRDFREFLVGMRETIARPQEVRSLQWEQLFPENPRQTIEEALELGRAIFVLRDYKARERRLNPNAPRVLLVNRRLGRLLLRIRHRSDHAATGTVFLNSLALPWTGNAIRWRMRRLREKFELPPGREKIVAYSFRHSAATLAAAGGVRDRVLADIMGHSSTEMTARYQHLQIEHLRSALDALDQKRLKGIEDRRERAANPR